jgi:hypothetical protein
LAISNKTRRLFLLLWVLGMAGVLSFLLVDLEALIAMVPLPDDQKTQMPPWFVIKLASVAQPAILVTVAVLIGMCFAPKVGLRAPASEAFAERRAILPELRPQVLPGVVAGILSGVAIVACWLLFRPFLDAEFVVRSEGFNKLMPAAVRFLYGGLTEEVLLRWGMMTFLAWLGGRLVSRDSERPPGVVFVAAIMISAFLFGILHLPIASLLSGGLTVPLTLFVVTANSIFGIVAGFLYWRRGLESAMIAHILAHVVLLSAVYLAS